MGNEEKVVWPRRSYTFEGPAKDWMSVADVCSYFGWNRNKLGHLMRTCKAFPRPRRVPGRGQGWWGRDIAAYEAIAELLGDDVPLPSRKKKKPPPTKTENS